MHGLSFWATNNSAVYAVTNRARSNVGSISGSDEGGGDGAYRQEEMETPEMQARDAWRLLFAALVLLEPSRAIFLKIKQAYIKKHTNVKHKNIA